MTVKRLVLLRRMWNLDQKAMANAIGVSHRTWQRIEYADTRITIDILFKLASLFQVSPGFFVESCVPLNVPWACLNCDYHTGRMASGGARNLRNGIPALLEKWLPILEGQFRESEARSSPLCEITLESFYLNPTAQKFLNLPLSQYSLGEMFRNKSQIALLFERLLGDAPGKRYAIGVFQPRFAAAGRRVFVQLIRLQKRSWDNPRFLSVIVEAGPLELDFLSLDVASELHAGQPGQELSVLLHQPVE